MPAAMREPARPCVLVFAGLDPSGGAGIGADIEAIAAQGAHALPLVTALTVQDNNRVHEVAPVAAELLERQAALLADGMPIRAVKIGIPGNRANAEAIARIVTMLRERRPGLPVVLDPVLASGHGDALARGDAPSSLAPLLALATVVTPNLPEAAALGLAPARVPGQPLMDAPGVPAARTAALDGWQHVLVTGGHGDGDEVVNRWFVSAAGGASHGVGAGGPRHGMREWRWPRLPGAFHGSGCTLASSLAARLALDEPMAQALENAQRYCNQTLADSYAIASGQRIPRRIAY